MIKLYCGLRGSNGLCRVTVSGGDQSGMPLPPRLDLRNHSPTGGDVQRLPEVHSRGD